MNCARSPRRSLLRNASGRHHPLRHQPALRSGHQLYTWGFAFRGEFQDPETKRITFAHSNIAAMEFIQGIC